MSDYSRRSTVALLIALLAPVPVVAALIDVSDVDLVAATLSSAQLQPTKRDLDEKTVPRFSLNQAEALSLAAGIPFPNLPNSVGQAFASSAVNASGVFGVGVNGFFFPNALPPNVLVASGSFSQTITNNSTVTAPLTVPIAVDFFVPTPTIQLFGVGNSFPATADPARDAMAKLRVTISTIINHPDGTSDADIPLDYGLTLFREPVSGVLLALPSRDAGGSVSRFDEPDGSFGFQLPDLRVNDFSLGAIGPGDVLIFTYNYFASASTGFGETGIFAAVGDPFDLSAGGGRFDLQVGGAFGPGPGPGIPAPGTLAIFGLGLFLLNIAKRGGWGPPRPLDGHS